MDESASSIDFDTLNARLRVMAECRNVDPEKALPYSTVEHVIVSREAMRLLHFVQRHGLYDQFIKEDKEGKR